MMRMRLHYWGLLGFVLVFVGTLAPDTGLVARMHRAAAIEGRGA